MIALALKALGLMRVSEHERLCGERFESLENMIDSKNDTIEHVAADRDEWEAKFKRAATDLAAQAEEIAALNEKLERKAVLIESAEATINYLRGEINRISPDAQKWRIARQKRVDAKGGRG